MRLDELGFLDDLPDEEERWNHDLHRVVRPERRQRPRLVGWIAVQNGDENHPDESDVCAVRLESPNVGKGTSVKTLCLAGAMEENVRQSDGDVVDETWRLTLAT